MKYLLFLVSLTIAIPSLSQKLDLKIDSLINLEIKTKQSRNVREIGYTKLACVNYGIRTTAYLFWNEGSKTYIQKFEDSEYDKSDVQRFQPMIIVDSVFFHFYRKNRNSLTSEEVKSFEYKADHIIVSSHSCFRHFRLYTGDIVFDKYFDFFDLGEFNGNQIVIQNYQKKELMNFD